MKAPPEWCQWRHSGDFIGNFEHIWVIDLALPLFFEQVIARWRISRYNYLTILQKLHITISLARFEKVMWTQQLIEITTLLFFAIILFLCSFFKVSIFKGFIRGLLWKRCAEDSFKNTRKTWNISLKEHVSAKFHAFSLQHY